LFWIYIKVTLILLLFKTCQECIIFIIINFVILFTLIICLHVICFDSPLRRVPFRSSLHTQPTV